MRYVSIIAVALILLSSCKVKKEIVTQQVVKDSIVYQENTITKYDTVFTPADSAFIKAYFQCDSLGNVLISQLAEEKGKLKVKTVFRDNIIEVLVSIDSAAIIRQAEKEFVKKYSTNEETSDTAITKKRSVSWWVYLVIGFVIGLTFRKIIKTWLGFNI